jgi:hypothetical protein
VTIQISGYDVQIGGEEAAMAYDKKAKELLGDKAKLNFPENKGATA